MKMKRTSIGSPLQPIAPASPSRTSTWQAQGAMLASNAGRNDAPTVGSGSAAAKSASVHSSTRNKSYEAIAASQGPSARAARPLASATVDPPEEGTAVHNPPRVT